MSHLKKKMANKCFSLLREYIDETPLSSKKEIAVLALDQLQKITAGTDSQDPTNNSSNTLTLSCAHKPRAA
ncbi:MAG: hypothetical protein PVH61_25960 [Candidatus Aminicenantes bacterium]|jgi:hypothetical protein